MGNFDSWTGLTAIDFSEGAAFIGDPDRAGSDIKNGISINC